MTNLKSLAGEDRGHGRDDARLAATMPGDEQIATGYGPTHRPRLVGRDTDGSKRWRLLAW
jgi:hypothetical protein